MQYLVFLAMAIGGVAYFFYYHKVLKAKMEQAAANGGAEVEAKPRGGVAGAVASFLSDDDDEDEDEEVEIARVAVDPNDPAIKPQYWIDAYDARPREIDQRLRSVVERYTPGLFRSKPEDVAATEAFVKDAELCFAVFVQAHYSLYDAEGFCGNALFVYSADAEKRTDLAYLQEVAERLRAVAEQPPSGDPEIRAVWDAIVNEKSKPQGQLLPLSLAPDGKTYLEADMFYRDALPGKTADVGFAPGLVGHADKGRKVAFWRIGDREEEKAEA